MASSEKHLHPCFAIGDGCGHLQTSLTDSFSYPLVSQVVFSMVKMIHLVNWFPAVNVIMTNYFANMMNSIQNRLILLQMGQIQLQR